MQRETLHYFDMDSWGRSLGTSLNMNNLKDTCSERPSDLVCKSWLCLDAFQAWSNPFLPLRRDTLQDALHVAYFFVAVPLGFLVFSWVCGWSSKGMTRSSFGVSLHLIGFLQCAQTLGNSSDIVGNFIASGISPKMWTLYVKWPKFS